MLDPELISPGVLLDSIVDYKFFVLPQKENFFIFNFHFPLHGRAKLQPRDQTKNFFLTVAAIGGSKGGTASLITS